MFNGNRLRNIKQIYMMEASTKFYEAGVQDTQMTWCGYANASNHVGYDVQSTW